MLEKIQNKQDMRRQWEDYQYLKSQYLPISIEILSVVEELCDQLEYEGSPMFDHFWDKNRFDNYVAIVRKKVEYLENFYMPVQEENENINISRHCVSCRGMDHWLDNLIRVIMLNEMNFRRQRYRQIVHRS